MSEFFSGTCPLFLQMAWISFNGFSRHLSGIFSQIDNLLSQTKLGEVGGSRLVQVTYICNDLFVSESIFLT